MAKKKKKGKKKKKRQIQQRGNQSVIALNANTNEKPSVKPHKVRYPCNGSNMAPSQPSSLNIPFVPMVSSPPQVNYVATCSIPTSIDDQFSDVVHYVLRALELDLSFLDMDPFQTIVLPSDESLLEVMTSYGS